MNRILDWLGKLPSTNARIVVSLLLAIGTGVKYWTARPDGWEPCIPWLAFLISMMGLDVAQYAAKRVTFVDYAKAKNNK